MRHVPIFLLTITLVVLVAFTGPVLAAGTVPPTIGLVMKTLTNPFFISMEKGARDAEKELKVR